jgi:hypothetical protein
MAGEMFFTEDVKSVKHVIAVMPRNRVALQALESKQWSKNQ